MELFHVGDGAIEPGQTLRGYAPVAGRRGVLDLIRQVMDGDCRARAKLLTGRGRLRRRFQGESSTQLAFIEVVFESARERLAPDAPSRFDSVFLWPSRDLAEDFRDRYRPHGVIHRCALLEGGAWLRDASLVAAGMDLSAPVVDQVRELERRAAQYWKLERCIGYPEVLARGTVVVTEIVSAGPAEATPTGTRGSGTLDA
jgi:hypothetical protein